VVELHRGEVGEEMKRSVFINHGIRVGDHRQASVLVAWMREYVSVERHCEGCHTKFPPMTLMVQWPGYHGRSEFCPACFNKALEEMKGRHALAVSDRAAFMLGEKL